MPRDKSYFEHTHMKMQWEHRQIIKRDGVVAYAPPLSPPPPTPSSHSSSSGSKISPAVLFIIVILAVLFFISGLLHLLVRFLTKHPSSSSRSNRYPEVSTSDALQRQLQQLFHLHDSGLDQAFIDALPVFMYEDIAGAAKEPFDCAVCLCEFSEKDQLRLLPMCGHAFHINCIDTWLLSNSSCPLCRGSLFTPGMSIENPIFDYDEFRDDDGYPQNVEIGSVPRQKTVETEEVAKQKGIFPVRLGKFRKLGSNGDDVADIGETSSSNLDARRCYSMGSYQYVVGDTHLKVALRNDQNNLDMRFKRGLESNIDSTNDADIEGKKISIGSKTDSYSVSKIWLWSKKGKFASSSDAQ